MSELTLVLIRFAYLAILWIFVLSAVSVVRSDMFGARVEQSPRAERRAQRQAQKQTRKQAQQAQKQTARKRRARGAPTRVEIVDGSNAGESVPLDGAPLLIGRGPDAAIRLDDDYVSTRHARIAASGEQWFVEDLGSTNGTYLGSRRLTQPAVVQIGSQIRIGKTTLELKK
jgi:pSer/pThr/pTyr-binding forkhead associated (FHA) protein